MDSDIKENPILIETNSEPMGKQLKSVWGFRGRDFLSVKGNLDSQLMYLFVLSEFYQINSGQELASRADARRGSSIYIYIYIY